MRVKCTFNKSHKKIKKFVKKGFTNEVIICYYIICRAEVAEWQTR